MEGKSVLGPDDICYLNSYDIIASNEVISGNRIEIIRSHENKRRLADELQGPSSGKRIRSTLDETCSAVSDHSFVTPYQTLTQPDFWRSPSTGWSQTQYPTGSGSPSMYLGLQKDTTDSARKRDSIQKQRYERTLQAPENVCSMLDRLRCDAMRPSEFQMSPW